MADLFSGIRKFMGKGEVGGVVGLDIGGAFMKVVELKKDGDVTRLLTYGELALGPLAGKAVGEEVDLPVDVLAQAVNDLFSEAKVTSRDVVIGIPLSETMITMLTLPDIGEEKLKEAIPNEARKYIPVPPSEVSLDWWVLPHMRHSYVDPDKEEHERSSGAQVDVLVVAVHNTALAKYQALGRAIKAEPANFEIELFSEIRSALPKDVKSALILDIGAVNTRAAVVEEGIVRGSHLINVGSEAATQAIAEAKKTTFLVAEEVKRDRGLADTASDPVLAEAVRLAIERIFIEANRIITRYEQDTRVKIEKVILLGGGALLRGMQDLVQKNFNTAVAFGDPFSRVKADDALAPILADIGPEFAVAVGLALRKAG